MTSIVFLNWNSICSTSKVILTIKGGPFDDRKCFWRSGRLVIMVCPAILSSLCYYASKWSSFCLKQSSPFISIIPLCWRSQLYHMLMESIKNIIHQGAALFEVLHSCIFTLLILVWINSLFTSSMTQDPFVPLCGPHMNKLSFSEFVVL